MFVFDPLALTWTNATDLVTGQGPDPRYGMGFTAAGGKIYAHGGFDGYGSCVMNVFVPSLHVM